jgi:predicted MPP superfamily phosphohydrolase
MFCLRKITALPQRIQVFGDLHGVDKWQTLLNTSADKIIFLGDYVDSHEEISDKQIVNNLYDLLALKMDYGDKVVLLWGNHDLSYLLPRIFRCSGYRISYARKLAALFSKNFDLFQPAYQENNWLFTHAGLTRWFWRYDLRGAGSDYAGTLNQLFAENHALFNQASFYRGGDKNYGSIFWADRQEFIYDLSNWLEGLNQVVGHQPVPRITVNKVQGATMIWLDTWTHPNSAEDAMLEITVDRP